MAAYLIIDVARVSDPEAYDRYRAAVPRQIAAARGRYLVRGGDLEVLEGTWRPSRVVVVEFPSAQAARDWWASAAYRELRDLRARSTTTHMILVEGTGGSPDVP